MQARILRTINGLGYPLYNGYGMTEIGVTSVELSPDVKQRLLGYIGARVLNLPISLFLPAQLAA